MDTTFCRLTVYFDEPFWVGVFEREDGRKLETARVVFGAEPKDYDVYDFLIENYNRLRFSPPVKSDGLVTRKVNPKRMRREANRLLCERGIGTKAQQALKLQREQAVSERKTAGREKSDEEKQRKFEKRQQKQKEKHKGTSR